jgi:uncharacterized integral membrane protein
MTVQVVSVRTVARSASPQRLVLLNPPAAPSPWNGRLAARFAIVSAMLGALAALLAALFFYRHAPLETTFAYAAVAYVGGAVLGALVGLVLGGLAGVLVSDVRDQRRRRAVQRPRRLWVRHAQV